LRPLAQRRTRHPVFSFRQQDCATASSIGSALVVWSDPLITVYP
jgi:hypothetical protein